MDSESNNNNSTSSIKRFKRIFEAEEKSHVSPTISRNVSDSRLDNNYDWQTEGEDREGEISELIDCVKSENAVNSHYDRSGNGRGLALEEYSQDKNVSYNPIDVTRVANTKQRGKMTEVQLPEHVEDLLHVDPKREHLRSPMKTCGSGLDAFKYSEEFIHVVEARKKKRFKSISRKTVLNPVGFLTRVKEEIYDKKESLLSGEAAPSSTSSHRRSIGSEGYSDPNDDITKIHFKGDGKMMVWDTPPKWLKIRYQEASENIRFDVPLEFEVLKDMKPLEYLSMYTKLGHEKKERYIWIYKKHSAKNKGGLPFPSLYAALNTVCENRLKEDNYTTLLIALRMVLYPRDTSLTFNQFAGISAFCERRFLAMYFPDQQCRGFLETADFNFLHRKVCAPGFLIKPSLKRLLFSLS